MSFCRVLGPKIAWADIVKGNRDPINIDADTRPSFEDVQNYINTHYNYGNRHIVRIRTYETHADLTDMMEDEKNKVVAAYLASGDPVLFQLQGSTKFQ